MEYFKIGEKDFSHIVSNLTIKTIVNYNAQTNAAGNRVVDFINKKRQIEVGVIPLKDGDMLKLLQAISAFGVAISFRNPNTNALEENVACIIDENEIDYYTIQKDKVMYNAATLTFTEL
jgi:hypothetical protein